MSPLLIKLLALDSQKIDKSIWSPGSRLGRSRSDWYCRFPHSSNLQCLNISFDVLLAHNFQSGRLVFLSTTLTNLGILIQLKTIRCRTSQKCARYLCTCVRNWNHVKRMQRNIKCRIIYFCVYFLFSFYPQTHWRQHTQTHFHTKENIYSWLNSPRHYDATTSEDS